MEPAVRGARTKSGIVAARSRITVTQRPELWLQMRPEFAPWGLPPGTDFLDAETGRQKPELKCADGHRDRKSKNLMAENARRNAPFGVVPETCGLLRLGGGDRRARTGDPPPSHRTSLRLAAGTEISDAETGGQIRPFACKRPIVETGQACEMPRSSALSAIRSAEV